MKALIVGGDRIESIVRILNAAGIERVAHWSGRKSGEQHQEMPRDTTLVVMLIDQVGHTFAGKVRHIADAQGLPIIYSPRSRSRLNNQLQQVKQRFALV
jgi:hypothetical protein